MKSVVYQHAYVADGIPDHKGHDRCALCGLPKERGVHVTQAVDGELTKEGKPYTIAEFTEDTVD